jgi:hypothetical protein
MTDARLHARGRFYNVVDLVNRLETEARNVRQGHLADHLTRMAVYPVADSEVSPIAHFNVTDPGTNSGIRRIALTGSPHSLSPGSGWHNSALHLMRSAEG